MAVSAVRHMESLEATGVFARALGGVLRGGDVVALHGELGAGKTTLVRELAAALGAAPGAVHSPTFVMVNQYAIMIADEGAAKNPGRLVHIDAYRLHSAEELDTLGWDTFMELQVAADARACSASSDAVVVIEWAERIAEALPSAEDLASITLTPTGEDSREVSLALPQAWTKRPGVSWLLERDPTRCRVTGKWVSPTSPTYPFADDRARMADLGRWFGGNYAASRDVGPEDLAQ